MNKKIVRNEAVGVFLIKTLLRESNLKKNTDFIKKFYEFGQSVWVRVPLGKKT